MRRVGLLLASTSLALAACNALTGAADLGVCATCDEDDAALATEASVDVFVPGLDASTRDVQAPGDAAQEVSTDAPPDGPLLGCQGQVDCQRVVFVSSTEVTGNLGGLAGADAKCQALADASKDARVKGRSFLAWVSTSAASPSTRLVHGTRSYTRVDGALIAISWSDLVSGGLRSGIALDENGIQHSGAAWTATSSQNAQLQGPSCLEWTSAVPFERGVTGNVGGNGNGWSSGNDLACSQPARLYCFER
jgi:hypothetical protein